MEDILKQILGELQGIKVDMVDLKEGQAKLEKRLDGLEQGQIALEKRLDGLEKRLDGLEEGQIALEKRLDGLEKRLDGLEEGQIALEKRLDGLEKRLDGLEEGQIGLGKRLDAVVDQTGVLLELKTEFVTFREYSVIQFEEIKDRLYNVETITASNWKDISQLKSAK